MVLDSDTRIKLPVFEGPLDLLLFLIRKDELDIYDIPIESVTRQYIAALRTMQELDLDLAGEFFVMAATLMEIKSRMLLPKGQHAVDPNAEEEDLDPRWELVYQLLQYKKFKDAAARLAEMTAVRQSLLDRRVSARTEESLDRPLAGVGRIELWNTFNIILPPRRGRPDGMAPRTDADGTVVRTAGPFLNRSVAPAPDRDFPRNSRTGPPPKTASAPGRDLRRHHLQRGG